MLNIKLNGITKCSIIVASILPADPSRPTDPADGGQDSTFSEHGQVAYQIKENIKGSNMVATFACRPLIPTLGMGSIGESSISSVHGHVAFQIKGNHQMQQHGSNNFSRRPLPDPLTLLLGSNGQNQTFCISN